MKDVLDFISNSNALVALGIVLVLAGLFVPRRFFGIEMDWSTARSAVAVILGAILVIFSFPQFRFWQTNTVNVDRAVIEPLASNIQTAIEAITSARSGDSYPWCADRAGVALKPLNDTLAALKKVSK